MEISELFRILSFLTIVWFWLLLMIAITVGFIRGLFKKKEEVDAKLKVNN